MATRVLIIVLFILSVLTSSALTYLLVSKTMKTSGVQGNVAEEVEKFIVQNPEIIIEGLRKAQVQRQQQEAQESEEKAQTLRPQLEKASGDGVAGNKDGDVTMVVFHDHNCGFCKRSIPDVLKLVEEDKGLKVVVKDFPILGPLSVEKSKASLAVAKIAPDKWAKFYENDIKSRAQSAEQIVEEVSEVIGVDAKLLRSEMNSKEVQNKIAENHSLAEQLAIQGTPVFIINGRVIRGAAGYDAFKQMIAETRADKSTN